MNACSGLVHCEACGIELVRDSVVDTRRHSDIVCRKDGINGIGTRYSSLQVPVAFVFTELLHFIFRQGHVLNHAAATRRIIRLYD